MYKLCIPFSHRTVNSHKSWTFSVTKNSFSVLDQISSLEHVIVTMSLSIRGVSHYSEYDYDDLNDYEGYIYDWLEDSHPRRGDIKIELTSPQGTKSILLPYRNYDFINAEGYDDWPFMSVHFWGENPIGTWTLKITYKSGSGYVSMSGLSMTLYGTATIPTAVSNIPSHDNTPTGDTNGSSNVDRTAISITVGLVVIASLAAVIFGVAICLVYMKRRNMRSSTGFVELTSNEVEI